MTADAGGVRCCGEHYPGEKDGPLVLACQLCRNSPTYWHIGGSDHASRSAPEDA